MGMEDCCRHDINTPVDEEGCCVSCGQDVNFIAINEKLRAKNKKLRVKNKKLKRELEEARYIPNVNDIEP